MWLVGDFSQTALTDFADSVKSLSVDNVVEVGYEAQTVEAEDAEPATPLPLHRVVGRHAQIVLSRVQEDALDLNLDLLNDPQ